MKFSAVSARKRWLIILISLAVAIMAAGTLMLYLVYVPKKYSDYVARYAAEYGVEEELAYAVIRAESNFREDAVSPAGARGLMQLMPSTAQFISECVGEDLSPDDPQDNIRMGVWYLSYLAGKFGGQTEVLAAYNAGEGSVRQWLNDPRFSENGMALSEIPLSETKQYVRRVKKFYNYYKFLY